MGVQIFQKILDRESKYYGVQIFRYKTHTHVKVGLSYSGEDG